MFWKSWKKKTAAEEFLEASDAKHLAETSIKSHILVWMVALLLFIFLIWAAFAEIDEVAKGTGKVIPSSKIQVIQHFEGGIIKQIFVKEGQMVKKGQVLITIDNSQFGSSYREGSLKSAALQAKIARLKAESEGSPLVMPENLSEKFPALADSEKKLYDSNVKELNAKLETLNQQVNQKKQEYEAAQEKTKSLKRSLELAQQEYDMTNSLYKDGAASKVEVLRLDRDLNDIKGKLTEATLQIQQTKDALAEAVNKSNEIETTARSNAAEDYAKAKAELDQQTEQNYSLEDRAARTTITSPVNGTIKVINVNTVGGSIKPGMDIMEIVPSEDTLLVEAHIRPADVAFIHPNEKALVKFTAYDFVVYGGLEGVVESISADSIVDENDPKRQSYYLVKVRTNKNHLTHNGKDLPIIPGMMVEVDILTGKKTVLDYILKPLLKSKQNALTER